MKLYKIFSLDSDYKGFWCEDKDTVVGEWGADEYLENHEFGDIVELRSINTSKITIDKDSEQRLYELSQLEATFKFSEAYMYIDEIVGKWVEIK